MYKLRIYHTSGSSRGMLKEERFFDTLENMDSYYNEIFREELYALNPTAWELAAKGWRRIEGY